MNIPLKFPNSPEGKRVLQAREEFHKAVEREKQLMKEERARTTGLNMHMSSENYQNVMKECKAADQAYYAATGDESQLSFPLPPERVAAIQKSVEKYFGKVARDLNSKLEKILPWIYGFATPYAIVTVGVYHGHIPSVCVKLRQRELDEKVDVCDGKDIGLGNIVCFQDPNGWKLDPQEISDEELMNHAEILLEYGQNFLNSPNADWAGLREWLQQKNEKARAEMPWLEKYRRH
jgi:hypothetical protein